MKFVTTKDLGYNNDQIVVVPTLAPGEPSDQIITQFRNKITGDPSVLDVTGVSIRFGGASYYGYKINGQNKTACVYSVDSRYVPLLNLKLVAGRNFDERIASDSNAVVVNEALVRDMQWKEPLDEYLNWSEDDRGPGAKVIGVVKDYHFLSLENEIGPMFLSMDKEKIGHLNNMMVKLSGGDIPRALEQVRKTWKQLNPDKPFEYSFLDEDVARQYENYTRWMKIAGLSTIFAILIACLGLFGLAGINAVNKAKEIGIRKVMGAEVINILILLNKQYVGMSFFAFALAAPCSWYVTSHWLATFEFKVRIGWEIFLLCAVAGVGLAMATVSYHTVRAALINPAETLKYE
jgi:putative ABC transport system permease protein